jgi:hypothetical protein
VPLSLVAPTGIPATPAPEVVSAGPVADRSAADNLAAAAPGQMAPPPTGAPSTAMPPPTTPPTAEPVPAPQPTYAPAASGTNDGSLSPNAVVEQVRSLLRLARTFYTDPGELRRLDELEDRLDEPLRVAIAGKIKAGKSTLLNGLVGEELAPTDASECTKIVTWYVDGTTYRATLHMDDGEEIATPFSRQSGAIDVDLQGKPADAVDHITVEWPSSSLTELSLIDTPSKPSRPRSSPLASERDSAAGLGEKLG